MLILMNVGKDFLFYILIYVMFVEFVLLIGIVLFWFIILKDK